MGEPIRSGSYELGDNMREWLSTWERPVTIEAEDFIQVGNRILVLIHWTGRGKGSGVEIEGRVQPSRAMSKDRMERWLADAPPEAAYRFTAAIPSGA